MEQSNLNFALAAPEILLLVLSCVILVVDACSNDRKRVLTYTLTQATLVLLFVITAWQWSKGLYGVTFHGLFVVDGVAYLLKLLSYVAVFVTLVYGRHYADGRDMVGRGGELYVLALLALLGQMALISASSLVSIFLGLELMSLALYALVAVRREHLGSVEAAMKYFILGSLATGFLLYGMSMLYGATGTLNLATMAQVLSTGEVDPLILTFGLVFLLAGLGFKLGVVPFHMWVPDVYQGSPTSVTLLLGAAPKLAAFAMTWRLLAEGLPALTPHWEAMLIVLAVASLVIGNLTAIMQTNFKRMLAYSTISHMGFVLLGFLGAEAGGDVSIYGSALFYMITYVLTTLGTFGTVLLLSRASGFEADEISDLKGLSQRHPWYALLMLLMMFSLAGIPPMVGFTAKLVVLQGVISAGYVWLAVLAVIMSLIGAFYYLRVVKVMYFDEPPVTELATGGIEAGMAPRVLLSINGVLTLVLGVLPGPLLGLCLMALQNARI